MTEIMHKAQATREGLPRSKRARMRLQIAISLAWAAGCTASAEEVRPPAEELYFPTGAAISPDQSVLFVANANSELRYDSGSISVVDLEVVDQVIDGWLGSQTIPADCRRDSEFTETLVCSIEGMFIVDNAGVRVGNFATDIAVQTLDSGKLRLVVPTRGDPSIAWADFDPGAKRLSCTESADDYALCDDIHRLSFVQNNADEPAIPEEPFSVFANSASGYAVVTHLTTGAVTLVDSPRDGGPAKVTDIVANVFLPDQNTGLRGATGVAGRTPNAEGDIVYVGSRSEDRVQTFTVARPPNGADPYLLSGGYFFLDVVGSGPNQGGSSDTRGMAFSADGQRLYLVNRRPPSLQIFDTSFGDTGAPRNEPLGATDICRQASTVTVTDVGDGERAIVTCFQDGQIYIIDPRGQGDIEDILTVGRGPYTAVASASRKRLYVTNFLEDTIAVVDLTPGARTKNRVVLRIGAPRSSEQ